MNGSTDFDKYRRIPLATLGLYMLTSVIWWAYTRVG